MSLITKKEASILGMIGPSVLSNWQKRDPEFRSCIQRTALGERIDKDSFRSYLSERKGFKVLTINQMAGAIRVIGTIGHKVSRYRPRSIHNPPPWPLDLFDQIAEPF